MTERPFTEETLALLLHLRLAQLLLGEMKDTQSQIPDINRIRKLAKEVFQKIDWFCEVSNKIMKGQIKPIEAEWDNRLSGIATITTFIATHPKSSLINHVDFIASEAARKDLLWKCWLASRGNDRYGQDREEFLDWYDKTMTPIQSHQTSNNEPIQ